MFPRRRLLSLISITLLAAACRKTEVTAYRVPKENDPVPPMAAAAAAAPTPAAPDMASTPVTTATGAALTWTAPKHWKPKPPSAMRKGSYVIAGDGGEGDLSITAFPGDVGGELANLNRWRGQIQLHPITEAGLAAATTHLDSNGLHLTFAEIVGTGASPQRILGAMIPYGSDTWFFKLSGPDALIAKEKPAFLEFLKSIKAGP